MRCEVIYLTVFIHIPNKEGENNRPFLGSLKLLRSRKKKDCSLKVKGQALSQSEEFKYLVLVSDGWKELGSGLLL